VVPGTALIWRDLRETAKRAVAPPVCRPRTVEGHSGVGSRGAPTRGPKVRVGFSRLHQLVIGHSIK
jgi:hypothetical protein